MFTIDVVDSRIALASASRDGHLTLRRVERQQAIIELLHLRHGERVRLELLAREFGVSVRTVERDVERLRTSGVPVEMTRGRGGGVSLRRWGSTAPVVLDVPEAAALIAGLTALGPSAGTSGESAMRKLVAALAADPTGAQNPSGPRGT